MSDDEMLESGMRAEVKTQPRDGVIVWHPIVIYWTDGERASFYSGDTYYTVPLSDIRRPQ